MYLKYIILLTVFCCINTEIFAQSSMFSIDWSEKRKEKRKYHLSNLDVLDSNHIYSVNYTGKKNIVTVVKYNISQEKVINQREVNMIGIDKEYLSRVWSNDNNLLVFYQKR